MILYHGTSSVFLTKILTEGLRSYFHDDNHIYLTSNMSEARGWAEMRVLERTDATGHGGAPVVLEVCVSKAPSGTYAGLHQTQQDEHFVYLGTISPECLKVL